MKKMLLSIFIAALIFSGCHKKTVPETSVVKKDTTAVTVKKIVKPKAPVPKVIAVDEKAAKKTIDGRYYYDLMGKRYYRNNRDGKYYLFNKSMYTNPDFNPVP